MLAGSGVGTVGVGMATAWFLRHSSSKALDAEPVDGCGDIDLTGGRVMDHGPVLAGIKADGDAEARGLGLAVVSVGVVGVVVAVVSSTGRLSWVPGFGCGIARVDDVAGVGAAAPGSCALATAAARALAMSCALPVDCIASVSTWVPAAAGL